MTRNVRRLAACLVPFALLSGCGESQAEADARQQALIKQQEDANRETARLLEEQRKQQEALELARLCDPLDQEQTGINTSFSQLSSDYPIAVRFLAKCLRDSTHKDQANGCVLATCFGASMASEEGSSAGCMDLGARLGDLADRQGGLDRRRASSQYVSCSPKVFPNMR